MYHDVVQEGAINGISLFEKAGCDLFGLIIEQKFVGLFLFVFTTSIELTKSKYI